MLSARAHFHHESQSRVIFTIRRQWCGLWLLSWTLKTSTHFLAVLYVKILNCFELQTRKDPCRGGRLFRKALGLLVV
jgi:hypothetical protein